ncbi:hypothetical protein HW49_03735 [Porphyromonadaceae bacterium COT-184 OH4590]|nr:hypothetical protein HW49_03735 [Porphyromonadaceae bacterium COT-184 OH4590]
MYDAEGIKTWQAEFDIYGKIRTFAGRSLNDCPFRYQGQYEDEETGLYYNRFRYYSPDEGMYISQDPISIAGGLNLYSYVHDSNAWVDIFGLTRGKRVEKLPKNLQRRPKWRKKTYEYLYENNPKTEDGKYISVKTQKIIEPGNEVIGHQNQSWREYQEAPENQTKTRKQVIEDYNDVTNLGFEDKRESSSDGGKIIMM